MKLADKLDAENIEDPKIKETDDTIQPTDHVYTDDIQKEQENFEHQTSKIPDDKDSFQSESTPKKEVSSPRNETESPAETPRSLTEYSVKINDEVMASSTSLGSSTHEAKNEEDISYKTVPGAKYDDTVTYHYGGTDDEKLRSKLDDEADKSKVMTNEEENTEKYEKLSNSENEYSKSVENNDEKSEAYSDEKEFKYSSIYPELPRSESPQLPGYGEGDKLKVLDDDQRSISSNVSAHGTYDHPTFKIQKSDENIEKSTKETEVLPSAPPLTPALKNHEEEEAFPDGNLIEEYAEQQMDETEEVTEAPLLLYGGCNVPMSITKSAAAPVPYDNFNPDSYKIDDLVEDMVKAGEDDKEVDESHKEEIKNKDSIRENSTDDISEIKKDHYEPIVQEHKEDIEREDDDKKDIEREGDDKEDIETEDDDTKKSDVESYTKLDSDKETDLGLPSVDDMYKPEDSLDLKESINITEKPAEKPDSEDEDVMDEATRSSLEDYGDRKSAEIIRQASREKTVTFADDIKNSSDEEYDIDSDAV